MWRPVCQQNRDSDSMDHSGDGCDNPDNIEGCSSFRQMWVWIHASAFSEGFDALTFACQKEVHILNLVLIRVLYFTIFFKLLNLSRLKLPTSIEVSYMGILLLFKCVKFSGQLPYVRMIILRDPCIIN